MKQCGYTIPTLQPVAREDMNVDIDVILDDRVIAKIGNRVVFQAENKVCECGLDTAYECLYRANRVYEVCANIRSIVLLADGGETILRGAENV